MTGILAGITLKTTLRQKYISLIQGLALQTKQIVEKIGNQFDTIVVTGGVTKNSFFMQTLSDVCEIKVLCIEDSVLSGTAMLAKQAVYGLSVDLKSMLPITNGIYLPNINLQKYYRQKWEVYLKMQDLSKFISTKK